MKLWQACGHVIKSGKARYTHVRHSLYNETCPRVLCSLDPNWQAASKAFSSLTESADPVKVLTAAQVNYSFHILAVGRNGARGGSPHVIFQPRPSTKSPPHNYFTLLRTHARGRAWVPRLLIGCLHGYYTRPTLHWEGHRCFPSGRPPDTGPSSGVFWLMEGMWMGGC